MTLFEIIPFHYLSVFEPYEIDTLLCGQDLIDIDDWQANTVYEGYADGDKVVDWFWKVVKKL